MDEERDSFAHLCGMISRLPRLFIKLTIQFVSEVLIFYANLEIAGFALGSPRTMTCVFFTH